MHLDDQAAGGAAEMSVSHTESALLASDFESFRRQESILASLNLILIAGLLIGRLVSTPFFGSLSKSAMATLACGFLAQAVEAIWLRSLAGPPKSATMRVLRWWSIVLNTLLAAALAVISWQEDTEYYVLMVVPTLVAAFRLGLGGVIAVVALADLLTFVGAYSVASVDEYLEAGAVSIIYTVVGVLVWLLVSNLRQSEVRLGRYVEELERTRERLLAEEKLAAVGKLSSAIAHEIRNPVTMIAASLATATRPGRSEAQRKQMLDIAAREADRLSRLTGEFLAYARPRKPRIVGVRVIDILNYAADVVRARAAQKNVTLEVAAALELEAELDPSLIQQALLNLIINAIDSCNPGAAVALRAAKAHDGSVRIDVVEPAGPIPPEVTAHLFEPFFTTKPGGTGLGLAIARSIARAHNGDLTLSVNEPAKVCFSLQIPMNLRRAPGEYPDGKNTRRR